MSDLMDIIRKRQSVRAYLDKPVEDEKIEQIIEAARLSPSACNSQCWRFVVANGDIREQVIKKGLGGLVVPNRWASGVPVIIVACADLNFITHKVGAGIKNIEYYLLDIGIAVEHLVLRATELGLGTCWIGWFNEREIRKLLKIPKSVKIVALITLGYPKEELKPHEKQRLNLKDILFWNKYGSQEKIKEIL